MTELLAEEQINTQDVNEAEADKTPTKEDRYIKCPCCGLLAIHKHPVIELRLMNRYLSCLFTGILFWQDYLLFNGMVRVRAMIPNPLKFTELNRLMGRLRSYLMDDEAKLLLNELDFGMRRLLYIKLIEIKSPLSAESSKVFHTYDICIALLEQVVSSGNSALAIADAIARILHMFYDPAGGIRLPFGLLSGVADAHAAVYNAIVDAGLDKNFWQGIKLTK